MTNDDYLAHQLKDAQTYTQVRALRERMDPETARRVIRNDQLSPLDRACLSLCLNFGQPSRFGHGEGAIIDPDDPPPS